MCQAGIHPPKAVPGIQKIEGRKYVSKILDSEKLSELFGSTPPPNPLASLWPGCEVDDSLPADDGDVPPEGRRVEVEVLHEDVVPHHRHLGGEGSGSRGGGGSLATGKFPAKFAGDKSTRNGNLSWEKSHRFS